MKGNTPYKLRIIMQNKLDHINNKVHNDYKWN